MLEYTFYRLNKVRIIVQSSSKFELASENTTTDGQMNDVFLQKSLELYEKSIQLLRDVESVDPQPEMVNNIGALHMQLGNYERAKDFFEEAQRILEVFRFNQFFFKSWPAKNMPSCIYHSIL